MFVFAFLWICFTQLSVSTNEVSLDEGRMLVSWSYNAAVDRLSFKVNASTIGWVGFGFARFAPNKMQDYVIILAGYKDGHGYIYDMYSMGQSPPPLDSSQDYKLVMATEEEGHTILHVERAGNTGDATDIQFTGNTELFFIWALHSSVDATNSSVYPFHERKGSSRSKHLIGTENVSSFQSSETSLEVMPPSTTSSAITPSSTVSSFDTAPLRLASSVTNFEFKSKPLSLMTSSTVNRLLERPSEIKPNSVNQTDLSQESSEGTQFSTTSVLSSSPSTNTELDQKQKSTLSSSGADNGKGFEQDGGSSQDEGQDKTNWIYFILTACGLFVTGCFFRQSIYWNVNTIRGDIAGLPQNNPSECEELIRQLHDQILALDCAKEKETLCKELKAVAYLGLHEDLKQMMKRKGLLLEGLDLVLKHLTDLPGLAEFHNFTKRNVVEDAGLKNISSLLGPDLEVLGRLSAAGIDVSKEWVKNLCKTAPSLQALTRLGWTTLHSCCQGAEKREIDEVYRLVGIAESHQLSVIPQDENLVKESKDAQVKEKEKLKKAKELMNEAKTMDREQSEKSTKTVVNEKLAVIMSTLALPSDWTFKHDEVNPEQMFEQLEQIIQQCSNVVESAESYKSEMEIITRASAGRALCGIYHSDYGPPKPAGLRLLQIPTAVTLTNPDSAQKIGHMKFSAKELASDYVEKVTFSSSNIGSAVSGFNGLLTGEVGGGCRQQSQDSQYFETYNTSASALHYIWTAKKTFQLERDDMKLHFTARKRAISITKDIDASADERENLARDFLYRYGSHFPAGVQTLGGVFFSIADVQVRETTSTLMLTQEAVDYLKFQMSVRFLDRSFGIGASVTAEHARGNVRRNRRLMEHETECFNLDVKSMGPPADPGTFHKLLSYSSNWALIDRGSFQGYIPVWELIRDLEDEFKEAAAVLEETWRKDEFKRKEKWEAQCKERESADEMKRAKDELQRIKKKHLQSGHTDVTDVTDGHWPTNGTLQYTQKWMKHAKAYDRAIEFIMRNPQQHFCEIRRTLVGIYTLKCWKASDAEQTTFRKGNVESVLLFSETCFKWKDCLPGRR